jgi:hypothetical protein
MEEIYSVEIPSAFSAAHVSREAIQECLWDLGDEFRHINYHIRDVGLTDFYSRFVQFIDHCDDNILRSCRGEARVPEALGRARGE